MFIVCLNIGDNQANQSPQLEGWDWGTVGLSSWHHVLCSPFSRSLPFLPSFALSQSTLSCGYVLKYANTAVKRAREAETDTKSSALVCYVATLSRSWETLNMLYGNERASDRHKYQSEWWRFEILFACDTNLSLLQIIAEEEFAVMARLEILKDLCADRLR